MTSPIDAIRRAARLRRAARAARAAEAEATPDAGEAERAGLPVPVQPARPIPRADPPLSAAAFDAQLLGQEGQKRGLRAGPAVIDKAKASYNRVQWSGSKDRRARKGKAAKTEV
jgi:hypothetical protein